ncbi:MAG: hypothetical protein LBP25_05540 [Tannerellaceae bacterium]|nr:hypothetical protein [Tannerellaceae bacterium]
MKNIFYLFAIVAWTAIVFTACTGAEHAFMPENISLAEKGEPAYATFTFKLRACLNFIQ